MIDVVLTYPIPNPESRSRKPALGIFYVGAMLEKHGFNVEYFDERYDSWDRLAGLIKQEPLCVGISSMTGVQLNGVQRIAKLTKKLSPKTAVVLGGVHASILPEESLGADNIDYVVVGEGELPMYFLVENLRNGFPIKSRISPDFGFLPPEKWPFPLTDKTRRYFEIANQNNELMYQTARGCQWRCRFCYNEVFNRSYREAPLWKVEKELKQLKQEFNPKRIHLCDDNMGTNRSRCLEIARIMKRIGVEWYASLRPSDVDVGLLKVLEDSGCTDVLLGAESGNDRILRKVIKKGFGVKDVKRCAKAFAHTSLRGRYNFIYGLPGQTLSDLHESMDLVDWILKTDKNAICVFDSYVHYPGTELYEDAIANGMPRPQGFGEWSKLIMSNTINPIAGTVYYISGLKTRWRRGDVTSVNFPGWKRLLILPFEIMAQIRWRLRWLTQFKLEQWAIQRLFSYANRA